MNLKYGLAAWFVCFPMLLVGTPQMLLVEGFECAPCTGSGGGSSCGAVTDFTDCNSVEDVKYAIDFIKKHAKFVSGERNSSVLVGLAEKLAQLPGASDATPQFVCVKVLLLLDHPNTEPDGYVRKMEYFSMCSQQQVDPPRPPRAEPYDSYFPPDTSLSLEGRKKVLWYVCDKKNEKDCEGKGNRDYKALTAVPTSGSNGGSTQFRHTAVNSGILITVIFSCILVWSQKHGLGVWLATCVILFLIGCPQMQMVEGVNCPICYRVGKYGSKSCQVISCDNFLDASQTYLEAEHGVKKSNFIGAGTAGFGVRDDWPRNGPKDAWPSNWRKRRSTTTKYVCAKKLGSLVSYTDSGTEIRVPLTSGRCVPFDAETPPKSEPYPGFQKVGPVEGTEEQVDKLYICDEGNQADCQISLKELNRASDPATTTTGDPLTYRADSSGGLICDVCARASNVPTQAPCNRMPCNSAEDAEAARIFTKQELADLAPKYKDAVRKEVATSGHPTNERGGGSDRVGFVCVKGLMIDHSPEINADNRMTMATCVPFEPSRTPQVQPYDSMPDWVRSLPQSIKKQLWYFCDGKNNEADCRVDEGMDQEKLKTVTPISASTSTSQANGRFLHTPATVWVLITVTIAGFMAGSSS